MGTKIEWTDVVWNPLAGCTWASTGCDHCYAAVMARRLEFMAQADLTAGRDPGRKRKYIGITHKNKAGRIMFNGRVNLDPEAIDEPLRWRKPRRVFVNSMSDLFHKDVPYAFIRKVWLNMLATPQHTYQVLTKRPERMAEVVAQLVEEGWQQALPKAFNIWLGTSVENQEQADARIPWLLKTPAHVRFLSCEPLLGAVDLSAWMVASGQYEKAEWMLAKYGSSQPLDWVIVGGESGPGARPMHPDWARSLRDQCQAGGVSYFFKQWGEFVPANGDARNSQGIRYCGGDDPNGRDLIGLPDGTITDIEWNGGPGPHLTGGVQLLRLGKHAAGRLLDSREWNEFPGMEVAK